MTVQIITGDCIDVLDQLEAGSVHCCVTSPPYFGLRDYGVEPTDWPAVEFSPVPGLPSISMPAMRCCLGLEADPWAFVAHQVHLFRKVRRVLRDDATLWLNLGDSYAGSWGAEGRTTSHGNSAYNASRMQAKSITNHPKRSRRMPSKDEGLKPKDLIGIPWRVAFALQADGWYLRQDNIWSKPNPMPESVADRCTKAHEYVFLLSKSARYYFDADAIREIAAGVNNRAPHGGPVPGKPDQSRLRPSARRGEFYGKTGTDAFRASTPTRNKRSVWEIALTPFADAHFAVFPEALPEPCILAGCPVGGTVLDPFAGAGTTGKKAEHLGRHSILIEIKQEHVRMAEQRTAQGGMILGATA